MRNTPIVTRQARRGFRVLPGKTIVDHPIEQLTPNKVHVVHKMTDEARG